MGTVEALISLCPTHPSSKNVHLWHNIDAATELASIQATMNTSDSNAAITPNHFRETGRNDQSYTNFINSINQGFLFKHSLTEPDIHNFWEVWHRLSTDGRIVIPKSLRRKVLHYLYTAHQGMNNMKASTNDTVYWPGMNMSIHNFRENCSICATIAPNQPQEPITLTPSLNSHSSKYWWTYSTSVTLHTLPVQID